MGINEIIARIKEEAAGEADSLLAEAREEIRKIEEEGKKEHDDLLEKAAAEKARRENEIKNSILLPARLAAKGQLLNVRRETLDQIFREAFSFGDNEYKKVLKGLVDRITEIAGGTIYPAKGDEARVKAFFKENGIDVKVEKLVEGIMGGFIFRKGRIEYDCSFATLMKQMRERHESEIAKELFGKE